MVRNISPIILTGYALSIPIHKANKMIRISMASIEYRKYKSIHKENINNTTKNIRKL
jgi:hypothetical protein